MRTLNARGSEILENNQKAASQLARSFEIADSEAVERVLVWFPQAEEDAARKKSRCIGFAKARSVIAQEQGFASWEDLTAYIAQSTREPMDDADDFVRSACSGMEGRSDSALALLREKPEIATQTFHTALVLGNVSEVERILNENPGLVSSRGGPADREPLLYVCFSCLGRCSTETKKGLLQTANLLTSRGANPNASIPFEFLGEKPTCLLGAAGQANDPELVRLLIASGANGEDPQSLMRSLDNQDLECFRLLVARISPQTATKELIHTLRPERVEALRLLLNAGADVNEQLSAGDTILHWAVWCQCSAESVNLLLAHGHRIGARNDSGLTAYDIAVNTDQLDIADFLLAYGDSPEASMLHRYLRRCRGATSAEMRRIAGEFRGLVERLGDEATLLIDRLIVREKSQAVWACLAAGFPHDKRDPDGLTLLHLACSDGYADIVKALLEYGASPTRNDNAFRKTPASSFASGARKHLDRGGDYLEVARLLVAAGATFKPTDLPTGNNEVDAFLRERIPQS